MTRLRPNSVALGAALLLVGCLGSTPPSRFYVLAPVVAGQAATADSPSVRVAPVELPQYLRGNEIVTRPSPNELILADLDRWGGTLEDDLTRVLTINLARLVPSDHVALHARDTREPFDFTVFVDVRRFEAAADSVVLDAHWTLSDARGRALFSRTSTHSRPTQQAGYAAVVAAMSAVLGDLSAEVAESIRSSAGSP